MDTVLLNAHKCIKEAKMDYNFRLDVAETCYTIYIASMKEKPSTSHTRQSFKVSKQADKYVILTKGHNIVFKHLIASTYHL
jgi:hypothetical protein